MNTVKARSCGLIIIVACLLQKKGGARCCTLLHNYYFARTSSCERSQRVRARTMRARVMHVIDSKHGKRRLYILIKINRYTTATTMTVIIQDNE